MGLFKVEKVEFYYVSPSETVCVHVSLPVNARRHLTQDQKRKLAVPMNNEVDVNFILKHSCSKRLWCSLLFQKRMLMH